MKYTRGEYEKNKERERNTSGHLLLNKWMHEGSFI